MDDPAAPPRTPRRRSVPQAVLGLIGLVGLVALVEILPRIGVLPRRYFPTSSEIGSALAEQLGRSEFWTAVLDTLQGWALGLAIASVAGVVLGILIGTSRFTREFTASTIEFLRPIPSVALIPIAVLLFGSDIESKLMLVIYASFWQVLIQVLYGVQDVDPVAQDTARAYGLGRWARIRHVTWPTALPYVMTGLRLAAAVALILAVTAELVIGNPGLGKLLSNAQSSGAVAATYAIVVVTGILGVLVNIIFRTVERRALSWHPSQRGGAGMSALRRVGMVLGLPVILLAAWWFLSAGSTNFFFPPLSEILDSLVEEWFGPRLVDDVWPSLYRLAAGYALAAAVSLALGVLIGTSRTVRGLTEPVFEFFRAIPPPVLVPIFILLFGIGDGMKVVVIAFGCMWPILLNTVEGVRAVDEVLSDTGRVYGVAGWSRLRYLVLPSASPQIFAGLRQGLSVAIILMVISELFAATNGLGFAVVQAQRSFAIAETWAGMLMLGLLGFLLALLFRFVENRQLRWYHGLRQAQRSS
ncbi:ABC transporter permease [Blastococcus brunescens]|uniref:ABC transporter permease n=1 Tax=Blastococcus brunescens TaxID=1564165 RepID=A0ABZ1B324_9ACTN|nr:ABC transporter permease [Blastococcus sp. BMG 8361]WRL64163.1 ABC transporter permease [Blastococcus sp. BMG 8361]